MAYDADVALRAIWRTLGFCAFVAFIGGGIFGLAWVATEHPLLLIGTIVVALLVGGTLMNYGAIKAEDRAEKRRNENLGGFVDRYEL